MKTKALYTLFGLLLLAGMTATIYFGMGPKPIPKIKFSQFEEPLKLSQAIELRMREELKKANFLAFGYQPERPEQLEIIRQFLKVNTEPGLKYDLIVAEEGSKLNLVQTHLSSQKNETETLCNEVSEIFCGKNSRADFPTRSVFADCLTLS